MGSDVVQHRGDQHLCVFFRPDLRRDAAISGGVHHVYRFLHIAKRCGSSQLLVETQRKSRLERIWPDDLL